MGGATNTESPSGAETFLGPWDQGTHTLTIPATAGHQVRLDFHLYILLTMDGNASPDVWRLTVPGAGTLINTTFANNPEYHLTQAYPGNYPGSSYPGQTGSFSQNTLGYAYPGRPVEDSIYHLSFTFLAKTNPLVISFTSLQDQAWPDEGWGVDNVTVTQLPGSLPGPPTTVTATAGQNSTASVSFTAPAADPPATSYRATCTSSTAGTTRTVWTLTSPATVTQVTGASTYSCQVRAVNALGAGTASAPSAPFTTSEGVPGAPTAVTVTRAGTLHLVAFTAPTADGGSPITYYTATCASSTGGSSHSGAATTSPVPVIGLTLRQAYICRVQAVNANGAGPTSTPSAPFTA